MIELTREQRQAVAQQGEMPVRIVNPDTHATYVLVLEETYARIERFLDEEETTSLVMEVFGREGWDDSAMDIYNNLDPRKPS